MTEEEEEIPSEIEVKVVLLGETHTGKTSLISKLINDAFSYNEPSTLVASSVEKVYEYKEYNNVEVHMEIWDTAGQEKFRSINKIFYKDATIAIFVYDITDEKSFEEIKTYWEQQVKMHGEPNVLYGIAGNKSDLYKNEKVKEKEAREYAKSIDAVFYLTSALVGTNINELFNDLGLKYLQKKFYRFRKNSVKIKKDKDGGKSKSAGCC